MSITPAFAVKTAPLHLLILDGVPIYQQLQLEEALLRADQRNWCVVNRGSVPSIVMGISGKPEQLINQAKLAQAPVPVIRRFSGGGTVFVDHDTFFISWICNAEHSGVACCPQKMHLWSEQLYQAAWPSLGMQLRENDYVAGDRKFGGNAQYLCKQRWLHHSSLLWDFKDENMSYLLMPAKMPAYRQQRGHEIFLCRLRERFSAKEELEAQFFAALEQLFCVVETSLAEALKIAQLPHRKATHLIEI